MKRQVQQVGVRKWFGDDWITIQDELFSVLEGFFGGYGQQFIISGCNVEGNNISAGIVGLIDNEGFHACRFAGANDVVWPVYFHPEKVIENRPYLDNQVKPVVETYSVLTSIDNPGGYFELNQDGSSFRFTEAIETVNRRFSSDAQHTNWDAQASNAINAMRDGVAGDFDTLKKIVTAMLLLAPKDSPGLTGQPTAPTQSQTDNSTKLANTAFVKAAIAALVDSSPGTLDTLNELAAALGDDPNFATTMLTALAQKAALASPSFTGSPKAPTPGEGDNSTNLATTAFVQALFSSIGGGDFLPLVGGTLSGKLTLQKGNGTDITIGRIYGGTGDNDYLEIDSDGGFVRLVINETEVFKISSNAATALGQSLVLGNDNRLTNARTPINESVTYASVANVLKSRVTDNGAVWDFSANGIIDATFSAAMSPTLVNVQQNKTLRVKLVITNSATITWPSECIHLEGSADPSGNNGTYYIFFDAWSTTEILVSTIQAAI